MIFIIWLAKEKQNKLNMDNKINNNIKNKDFIKYKRNKK